MDNRGGSGVSGHPNRASVVLDAGIGQRRDENTSGAGSVINNEQVGAGGLVLDEDDDPAVSSSGSRKDFSHSRIGDIGLRMRKVADKWSGECDIGHKLVGLIHIDSADLLLLAQYDIDRVGHITLSLGFRNLSSLNLQLGAKPVGIRATGSIGRE